MNGILMSPLPDPLSEPLSSWPFLWPSTSTSTSVFPPGRSLSSITTVIGPSTFLPGVTSISPVFGLITTGTSLPSSSLAVTFVSLSGFLTITPVPCFLSVGLTGFLPVWSTVVLSSLSEPLSSLPFSWPLTSTSTSVFPPGRSGSSTTTFIGPSTSSPGVTITFPSLSISTGISFPSSSLADIFVSSSLFSTLTPVSWGSFVGSTGFLPDSSTLVLELLSSLPASWPFTGTTTVCSPSAKSGSDTVTLIGPSTFVPGVT